MKVSVCVITFNQDAFIGQCLESILNQKCDFSFEIIVGEDKSSDDTFKICQQYQSQYPELIKLLPSEKNIGMMPNFIRTLAGCSGGYIAICEGDDYWTDPYKLQKQVDFLEKNTEYSMCFTNTEYINERTGESEKVITSDSRSRNIRELVEKNFVATQTVMYRNMNLTPPKGFEKLKVGDWPLHVLYAQYGNIGHINDFTAAYRIHENNSWNGQAQLNKVQHMAEAAIFLSKALEMPFRHLARRQSLKSIHHLIDRYRQEKNKDMAKKSFSLALQLPTWWLLWKVYYLFLKAHLD